MWVSTGCSPCPPLGCTRRRAPRISAYAYSAPADADRPRGMEASGAVSWPFSSVLLPLASFSGALCNVATNCDKLSELRIHIPTVSLGVTSAVVSSCGHDSGQIEQLVAQELAAHWATHEGPAERPQHRHPPHAQPLAPVRQHHGRRPRLTTRGCPDQTPPSDAGQPCGRIREEQRHHRSLVPRDAMPRRRSSFRLLAMASPYWMIYVNC